MKNRLFRMLRFDEAYQEFELLETERGKPPFFAGMPPEPPKPAQAQAPVSPKLEENEARLKQEYRAQKNPDILFRRFRMGGRVLALSVCINGMANGDQVSDFILRQGMREGCMQGAGRRKAQHAVEHVFAMQEAELCREWKTIKQAISEGRTAVFLDGDREAILMDTRGFISRSVETAQNEKVVRGPQEGFNENLRTNVTLLRRIIKTDDFICEFSNAGGENGVRMVVAYRDGVANDALIKEVKAQFCSVKTRNIQSVGMLEQLAGKKRTGLLPKVLVTERPDRVAAHIMQGHAAILLEGSPDALVLPATLFTLMATPEDVNLSRPLGSLLRVVRYIGAALSVLLPGYFLAMALHHPGMLSTEVVATILLSRRMVFLPLAAEMLFLLWVFQLLREAGLRVPGGIGQAIGIIGGLLLGSAAVEANMVSTLVLIIVALTGLGGFTIPDYGTQLCASYIRVLLVILAWLSGLLGFVMGVLLTAAWMAKQKSFGVPFLAPVAPKVRHMRPAILRGPLFQRQRAEDYMNTGEKPS